MWPIADAESLADTGQRFRLYDSGTGLAPPPERLDGQILGRLNPGTDDERTGAREQGYDIDRVLRTEDLVARQDIFFAASGVTDGELRRVRYTPRRRSRTDTGRPARAARSPARQVVIIRRPRKEALVTSGSRGSLDRQRPHRCYFVAWAAVSPAGEGSSPARRRDRVDLHIM
jgi:Bacterial fructose-1,6-bisphosphatase, glpX-encoded